MTFADLARRASKLAIDNSPAILTSIGVVGTITTAFLASKASVQAVDIIRLKEGLDYQSEEDRRDNREVLKQRAQLVWRLYIPPALMCAATVTCIIGANRVGARRAAGLAAATTILEKTFEEYKSKVIEKIGERKEDAIHDEIAQERVTDSYHEGVEIYGAEVGELCYDKFSDRFFRCTVEGIRAAENSFNFSLIHDGYASLAEFYRILDIPAPAYSEQIGWNADRLLEVKIASTLTPTDKPCISIEFRHDPSPDYGRFR
jgi:hypothetical protein